MIWSVGTIKQEDVSKLWHKVAPLLAEAVLLSGGRYDMKSVFKSLQEKRSLLWVVTDADKAIHAAFTTREAKYPCASFLCIDFLGGENLKSWVETADDVLTRYAKDTNMTGGIELIGRAGWARVLSPLGWERNAVMVVKASSTDGV